MKIKNALLITLFSFTTVSVLAQVPFNDFRIESIKGDEIICPAIYEDANTFVDLPDDIKQKLQNKNLRSITSTNKAEILVDYRNFPANAQTSFQRAIDTWAAILDSDVPVRVLALYQALGPSVLGSASPTNFYRNFPGTLRANTWFPVPLAEKISGRDLNTINDYDIVCRFSSDANWYFGRLVPAVGQFDFESVVLHELCHGLGFIGSLRVNETTNTGIYGTGLNTSPIYIYDTYTENRDGKKLTDTVSFKNNSVELRRELLSDELYFNSPNAVKNNNNIKPRIYAPNQWAGGSSYSHLNDATYPAGNRNSLMTSGASLREKILDPGPITTNMFNDMGWKRTAIIHDRIKNTNSLDDIVVNASVLSDTTFDASSLKLTYALDSIYRDTVSVIMRNVGGSNFQATIPTKGKATSITYTMKMDDRLGRPTSSPPDAPRFIWSLKTGQVDKFGPTIDFDAPNIVSTGNGFAIVALVEDDFAEGVDTVIVNYKKNGVNQPAFGLSKYDVKINSPNLSQGFNNKFSYVKESAFGNLTENDRIEYQITARDKSGNTTIIPTRNEGTETTSPNVPTFYNLVATTLSNSVKQYFNDFNTSTSDFALVGFNISTPATFNNGNLNTQEGYSNGKGLADPETGGTVLPFENNQIAMLRSPIILDSDKANATISFDEVVLVEPGEAGSEFGDDDFWDYVVVEGSTDGGQNWVPFTDGYDSRENTAWLNRFNNTLSPGGAPVSNGKGEQALYKSRTIKIYDENFSTVPPGTEVLVRFRLFSDQWVRGWGWAIDNLRLQIPVPKPLANEEFTNDYLKIMPNPTSDFLNIKYAFSKPQQVNVEVFKATGGKILNEYIATEGNNLDYKIDVRNYTNGVYIVKVTGNEGFKAKKFVVAK